MPLVRYMKPISKMLTPQDSLDQAQRLFENSEFDTLPVVERDRLVGVLTRDDMSTIANLADYAVAQVMRWRFYCYNDDGIERSVAVMRDQRVTSVPVMDDSRRVLGMIRLKDLMKDRPGSASELTPASPRISMSA